MYPDPVSCSILSPSPSTCPLLTPTRLFPWQQQNPLRACKLLSLCFISSPYFPLFCQTLTAGSWQLPILVPGDCLIFPPYFSCLYALHMHKGGSVVFVMLTQHTEASSAPSVYHPSSPASGYSGPYDLLSSVLFLSSQTESTVSRAWQKGSGALVSASGRPVTHVNPHAPLPSSIQCTRARNWVIEEEGGFREKEWERLAGWVGEFAIRHMQRQMLCSAARRQKKRKRCILLLLAAWLKCSAPYKVCYNRWRGRW